VKVCDSELSPLVGAVDPTSAEYVPECAVVVTLALPAFVQPESVPVSKPPLVIPAGGGAPMATSS